MSPDYPAFVERVRSEDAALADELASLVTLEGVLNWLRGRDKGLSGLDVLAQDEYSHDLLVPIGPGERHLAFGMT